MNILTKSRDSLLLQKTALENQLREANSHDCFEFKILNESYLKIIKTFKTSKKNRGSAFQTHRNTGRN